MSWKEDDGDASGQNPGTSPEEDLFVFGYGCKIFRDDEKAKWIESEKHLIPWMGDTEGGVLIDRYDGRGALMDLREHEPPPGGANYLDGLSSEELEVEKLCEIERYRDFDEDAEYDENVYQEAEFKRLQMAVNDMGKSLETAAIPREREYGKVGYSYNDNPVIMGPEPKKMHSDVPYSQPADLIIPPEIALPTTMKSHAIMEKTAKFIASHGTQMEIILKTKQSKNPQFDFLSHNDPMNPYYKFLVHAIKNGMYKPPDEIQYADDSDESDRSSDGSDDDGYLHPSLMTNKKSTDITSLIPQGSFKPSSNCAYSMLVSKIKESAETNAPAAKPEDQEQSQLPTGVPAHPAQYQVIPTMPPPQDQLIIDKMAAYVVKNGTDFETLARTKGDPRFAFLDPYHHHNWYYISCKERCQAEVSAVVASKSFVSYKEAPKSVENLADGVSTVTSANFSTKPYMNQVTEILPKKSVVLSRMRPKDAASAKAKTSDKEKTIKLPVSLPNFATVLKQQSQDESESTRFEKMDTTSAKLVPDYVETPGIGNDKPEMQRENEEEAKKLKEERRKKAALFLQRLKKSQALQAQATKSKPITNAFVASPEPEVDRDIEIISCSANLASRMNRRSTSPEITILPPKESNDPLNDWLQQGDNTPLSYKTSRSKENNGRSSSDHLGNSLDDRKGDSRHRSRSRSRKKRPSSSSRSPSSSSSSSSHSHSSSHYSKRKKSKRKHSRKRLRKRERSRSKSRSKKSKKRHR